MIKKFLLLFFSLLLLSNLAFAEQTTTLKAGVAIIDKVPKEFFGTWRVTSELVSTNSEANFKTTSVDIWNLSRDGNVITLENPFSGAQASIVLDEVNDTLIKFKKNGDYDNKKLTDIVQLKLERDKFYGTNYLILETLSDIDNSIIKVQKATYRLSGEKISGSSIK